MKQIQKVSVQTPLPIQLLFLLMIALGAVWFLFSYQYTNASSYCERQFNISFFQKISPRAEKVCRVEFQRITNEWETGLYTNK